MDPPKPRRPFECVSCDLFFFGGYSYIVYVDRFSGWPNIHRWNQDPSSKKVKDILTRFFSDYGIPISMRSDGGPQFKSDEFENFMTEWNKRHEISSPHHHESNGHAESAVKAMKLLVKKTSSDITTADFLKGLLE